MLVSPPLAFSMAERRHVANDEAQYYIHLRLYCRLYVYKYVYPIQIYQIYCIMLAVLRGTRCVS